MATYEKRGDAWRVKIRKGGVSLSESGFRTKREAEAWAVKKEAEISAQAAGLIPDKTFGDLLARYADEVSPRKRGERAEQMRIALYQREFPVLMAVKLASLSNHHFSDWRDQRLKMVSAASVRREWALLQHALNIAVKEWGWIKSSPLDSLTKPAAAKARTRRPTDLESEAILLATGYHHEMPPFLMTARVGAAWLFAIETGMRASEICGLTRESIDFDRRLAHLAMTKNGHARDVPLSVEAVRLLRQVMEAVPDGPVFGLRPSLLDSLFRKAKAQALIEDLHFHDSRREALTRLAKKVDVMTLAKISGHRDLRILQNTYYAPDMADVVALLD